ncbi:hypothetical protein N7517_011576 [Penicillium concentricum]|uniref:Uncharacterized protein n=1 Tax=Penicillium concentricum TaxID=293559 RepID=A0A9W9UTN2_9EURO|nr:uncharacterized protein N7517_011576 [Penicillium concentricum]KAJ5356967.1 hypothetical protein N7517_011576 [Penicillium concentricum]
MSLNVYTTTENGRWEWSFYIELDMPFWRGRVERMSWTHFLESDQSGRTQCVARLNRNTRSESKLHKIATIEEGDVPWVHEICLAASVQLREQVGFANRDGPVMPTHLTHMQRQWWLSVWKMALEKGIFTPDSVPCSPPLSEG